MASSNELAKKSIDAVISAIEIYNKPDFSYREEAFSLLMVNGWELLLKAKWLADNNEDVNSLYVPSNKKNDNGPRLGKSGNPITHGIRFLAENTEKDQNSGLKKPCLSNILALVEVRDNAAHFVNKDIYFGRRILEIGTASLRNYVQLATEWFQLDLTRYNFFLMPISFYHGFEAVLPINKDIYPEQVKNLFDYIDCLEEDCGYEAEEGGGGQQVSLKMETRLVKGNKDEAIEFKWTNDPTAPAISLKEEDVAKNYPYTYREMTDALKRRYSNFIENKSYHKIRKEIEKEDKYCLQRLLNPRNPNSSKQRFYNSNIFQEFDKHYEKRIKP